MPEARYQKGDSVRFRLGLRFVEGVVSEDRGPLGVKGRHLYGVKFLTEPDAEELSYIELPAVDLELVAEPAPAD